ncbi:MAG: hypothetical protein LBR98_07535, partial [Syntrophomonadaceae bacterium]|nr:hypothetical protein [Syntrophomonadaceae bacterium]
MMKGDAGYPRGKYGKGGDSYIRRLTGSSGGYEGGADSPEHLQDKIFSINFLKEEKNLLRFKKKSKKLAIVLAIAMMATMFMGLGSASATGTYSTLAGAGSVGSGIQNLSTVSAVFTAGTLSRGAVLTIKLPADFTLPGADGITYDVTANSGDLATGDLGLYVPELFDGTTVNALYNDNTGGTTTHVEHIV